MIGRAFALTVFLAACIAAPREFPVSRARSPMNKETAVTGTDQAALICLVEWERILGVDLPATPPRIRWFIGDPLAFKGLKSTPHSGYRYGLEIQLTATPGGRTGVPISETDLAHEMLHWALHMAGRTEAENNAEAHDRDPGSLHMKGEREVRAALKAAGF